MLMPTIQSSEIWKESGRYDDYGEEILRIKDRQGREMLYGPTNEELITDIFRSSVKSYKSPRNCSIMYSGNLGMKLDLDLAL